jgi:hypothetical protein
VNAPVIGAAVAVGDDEEVGDDVSAGDGETCRTCPVDSMASCAAGTKYAMPPAIADMKMASTTMKLVRKGLSRRRDALTRCPLRKPSGTGQHCTPRLRTWM